MGTKGTGKLYLKLCSFFVKKRETKGEERKRKRSSLILEIRNRGIFFPTGFQKIHVEIFIKKWYHEK